ncbi:MAG: helix-turn-helix transcriptional regulator [Acidobacteriota bacterium]
MNHLSRSSSPTLAVGQRIRQRRLEHHLTQTELARQIGIQQSDLSRMEKGEYRVSLDVLFRILQVLELSLGEFFSDLAQQGLTPREGLLLSSFRSLSREAQQEVVDFVDFKRNRAREAERGRED